LNSICLSLFKIPKPFSSPYPIPFTFQPGIPFLAQRAVATSRAS
jgi:hypothetical protein